MANVLKGDMALEEIKNYNQMFGEKLEKAIKDSGKLTVIFDGTGVRGKVTHDVNYVGVDTDGNIIIYKNESNCFKFSKDLWVAQYRTLSADGEQAYFTLMNKEDEDKMLEIIIGKEYGEKEKEDPLKKWRECEDPNEPMFVEMEGPLPTCCDECKYQGKADYCDILIENTHGKNDGSRKRLEDCPLREV